MSGPYPVCYGDTATVCPNRLCPVLTRCSGEYGRRRKARWWREAANEGRESPVATEKAPTPATRESADPGAGETR